MSDKSVAQKLGMKPGKTLLVQSAPLSVSKLLGEVPKDSTWVDAGKGPFPIVLWFVENYAAMIKLLPAMKKLLEKDGAFWIAYAKGGSPKATDINRDSIREYVIQHGLDTVAQIAIDADWSALRCKLV